MVGVVQLRAQLDAGIIYACRSPVHALCVCPSAHAAHDVDVLVRVGVVEVPTGVCAGQGGGICKTARPDLRPVESLYRSLFLVPLPVIHPQPPGVNFQDKAVVFA